MFLNLLRGIGTVLLVGVHLLVTPRHTLGTLAVRQYVSSLTSRTNYALANRTIHRILCRLLACVASNSYQHPRNRFERFQRY